MVKKPASYSFSRLDLFGRCPLAYKKIYLDKIPRGTSDALITGSTVHEVVASYLEHLIKNSLATDWEWAVRREAA
jgi:hypothetical protein